MQVNTLDPNGFDEKRAFDSMDASKSLNISFSMYEYDGTPEKHHSVYGGFPHPRDIEDPPGVAKRMWVPQTCFDAIWKLYEFDTVELRDAFLENPPEVYAEASISMAKQAFYDHWVGALEPSP